MNATTHRTFVSYIDRTREFYAAQGYEKPYQWARNSDVPFANLTKPLSDCRVTLVTTASPLATARATGLASPASPTCPIGDGSTVRLTST